MRRCCASWAASTWRASRACRRSFSPTFITSERGAAFTGCQERLHLQLPYCAAADTRALARANSETRSACKALPASTTPPPPRTRARYGQRALVNENVGSLVNTLTLHKTSDLRLEAFARLLSEEWDVGEFCDFLGAQALAVQVGPCEAHAGGGAAHLGLALDGRGTRNCCCSGWPVIACRPHARLAKRSPRSWCVWNIPGSPARTRRTRGCASTRRCGWQTRC